MKTAQMLKSEILRIDGRGYPNYRDLKGQWDFGSYVLSIDHVQSDPYASPSDVSIYIPKPGFPQHLYENKVCRIALQDQLLRMFGQALKSNVRAGGSKQTGSISCAKVTQEILERSACTINPENGSLIFRLNVGFPARGRTILGGKLIEILFHVLPELVCHNLIYENMTLAQKGTLQKAYELSIDQQAIRKALTDQHLAAFVADGSILPRASGASSLPMKDAIPFVSTKENEVFLDLPYAGKVRGLGIPQGITLIVGGGYHGKSTLLNALEMGVYDHIAKDGREFVITQADAAKIRSEDGRCVHTEDISSFIQSLPNAKSTTDFVSEDASGSTSQAANVMEALESGSRVLLIDEDTSATNFMIRDELMSEVVASSEEPIIPYIARIRELADHGVSTILVAGSSGAYFDQADQILQMKNYEPHNITAFAKEKANAFRNDKKSEYPPMKPPRARVVKKNPVLLGDKVKVKTNALDTISIAREPIDIRALEQLVDSQQTAAIGKMILYAQRYLVDGQKTTEQLADELESLAHEKGLSFFGKGAMAMPRRQELLGALNRMRSQQFVQK